MKDDLIFAPILLVLGIMLFLLRVTGLIGHIIISAIGIAVLVAYSIRTKKTWKIPTLEIIMRAFYGMALISGVVIMNVSGMTALAIAHKISAALFVLLLVGLFVLKVTAKKVAKA